MSPWRRNARNRQARRTERYASAYTGMPASSSVRAVVAGNRGHEWRKPDETNEDRHGRHSGRGPASRLHVPRTGSSVTGRDATGTAADALDGRAVWFSTRRGFRFGVAGMPDDRGSLHERGHHLHFAGRRFEFDLSRPARLSLVHEPPGLAPLGGIAIMVLGFLLAGVSPVAVLVTLGVTALLLGANMAASRWVRLEQLDEDGETTIGYLTPGGLGRYTSAPRALLGVLGERILSPERAL